MATWSDQVGADGEMTRVRSRNTSGEVTLTLVAATATNQALALLQLEDEQFGTGVGVLSIRDTNGLDLHKSNQAWITMPPEAEYAKEATNREWTFRCKNLITNSGGSVL